jgi:integrase
VAKTLTLASVTKTKPTRKRRFIPDGGSQALYLVVQPSGHRSWALKFRRGSGPAKIHLGPLALENRPDAGEPVIGQPLMLPEARRLASRLMAERASGVDIFAKYQEERRRRRIAAVEAHENSFLEAARAFVIEHARPKVRTWKELARNLGLDEDLEIRQGGLAQRWADRNIQEISAADLHLVIEEAGKLGIPGVEIRKEKATESRAHKIYSALSSMFSWLQKRRRIENDPTSNLHPPSLPSARDRVLSAAEIRDFWNATNELKTTVGDALKLVLLCGARLNEIVRLRWDEVGLDASLNVGGTLIIAGSRTKNGRALVLPLPEVARDIVDRQPRNGPFVFAANSVTAITVGSKIKSLLDALMGHPPPWRLHDLRQTAVTGMAELGVRPDVIELIVNHISGSRGGIAGIYNRSELLSERREALQRWANHLATIIGSQP